MIAKLNIKIVPITTTQNFQKNKIIMNLLRKKLLITSIKKKKNSRLALGFFYVGSSHPAASFYGFMAGLITFTINLAGYKFSKR